MTAVTLYNTYIALTKLKITKPNHLNHVKHSPSNPGRSGGVGGAPAPVGSADLVSG